MRQEVGDTEEGIAPWLFVHQQHKRLRGRDAVLPNRGEGRRHTHGVLGRVCLSASRRMNFGPAGKGSAVGLVDTL